MRALAVILVAFALQAGIATADDEQVLRAAVGEANAPPFVLYAADGRFAGGLAHDIIESLAATLQVQPLYLNTPRGRIEPGLRGGELDVACFLAPEWVSDRAGLNWSPVLFRIQQVIVTRAGQPPIRSAAGLQGLRVGTQLNFRYPELEPMFAAGRSTRVDGPSAQANLLKLRSGRIDALLDVDLSILYAIGHAGWVDRMQVEPLWVDSNPVHCAFSNRFVVRHPAWRETLQAMVDDGEVERWIEQHVGRRDRPLAPVGGAD